MSDKRERCPHYGWTGSTVCVHCLRARNAELEAQRDEAIKQRDELASGDFPLWSRLLILAGGDSTYGRQRVVEALEAQAREQEAASEKQRQSIQDAVHKTYGDWLVQHAKKWGDYWDHEPLDGFARIIFALDERGQVLEAQVRERDEALKVAREALTAADSLLREWGAGRLVGDARSGEVGETMGRALANPLIGGDK